MCIPYSYKVLVQKRLSIIKLVVYIVTALVLKRYVPAIHKGC